MPVSRHHLFSSQVSLAQMEELPVEARCAAVRFCQGTRGVRERTPGEVPAPLYLIRKGRDMEHRRGPRIPATGSRRRLQALIAEGFSYRILITELGIVNPQWLHEFCKRDILFTHIPFAQRVDDVYAKLQLAKPEDFGLMEYQIRRAKRTAVRHGWGNVMCWDDDTIEDPNAIPEWTGLCGTTKGWDIHMRENILMCAPCQSAVNSFRGPQYAQAA